MPVTILDGGLVSRVALPYNGSIDMLAGNVPVWRRGQLATVVSGRDPRRA